MNFQRVWLTAVLFTGLLGTTGHAAAVTTPCVTPPASAPNQAAPPAAGPTMVPPSRTPSGAVAATPMATPAAPVPVSPVPAPPCPPTPGTIPFTGLGDGFPMLAVLGLTLSAAGVVLLRRHAVKT